MQKYFDEYDENRSNALDRQELRHFLTSFFNTYHIKAPVTDEYVDAVFREIDINRNNKVEIEELHAFSKLFVKKLVKLFQVAKQKEHGDVALADQVVEEEQKQE